MRCLIVATSETSFDATPLCVQILHACETSLFDHLANYVTFPSNRADDLVLLAESNSAMVETCAGSCAFRFPADPRFVGFYNFTHHADELTVGIAARMRDGT